MVEGEKMFNKINSEAYAGSFAQLLAIEAVETNDEKVEIVMPVTKDHTTTRDIAHAGASLSLAMLAMEQACAKSDGPGFVISMDVNFMRPAARATVVKAVAFVVHKDGRTAIVEATIVDELGRLVLKATATLLLSGS